MNTKRQFMTTTLKKRALWKTLHGVLVVATVMQASFVSQWLRPSIANASSTQAYGPTTNAPVMLNPNSSVGHPERAYLVNDTPAEFTDSDHHQYGGFGISVPADATITGIEVEVRAKLALGKSKSGLDVFISNNGGSAWGSIPTARRDANGFTGKFSTVSVGGPNDLWGRSSWSAADVATLAVRLSNDFNGRTMLGVDAVKVRVHHFTPAAANLTAVTPSNYVIPSPTANPTLSQSCGLDIGLVVDTSDSVDAPEMSMMKTALTNFTSAFVGTPTEFSISSFSTNSSLVRDFTSDINAIQQDIANVIPPSGSEHTNWDSGLARGYDSFGANHQNRPAKSDLMVIVTDGSPNRLGYPSAAALFDWDNGEQAGYDRASAIKQAGMRIVAIGIGEDEDDPATPAEKLKKLVSISGPTVATDPSQITPDTDVIKVTSFNDIGAALAGYAKSMCGGKIVVQKQYDTNRDGVADLTGSTASSLLSGYAFSLQGLTTNPVPQTTTATGALEFTNIPTGSGYSITEVLNPATQLMSAQCSQAGQTVGTVDLVTGTVTGLSMGIADTITCTFVNAPAPLTTLTIDKTAPATIQAGGVMTYNIAWSIGGNTTATNVVVTDPLPANTTLVSATCGTTVAPCTIDTTTSTVKWSLGDRNPGAAGSVTMVVKANSPLSDGTTIINTATLSSTNTPPVSDTVTTTASAAPAITLVKTGPSTISSGGTITYSLKWTVTGNAPQVTGAVITDSLPANTTFVSASDNGVLANGVVTWNLGTKLVGSTGTVTLVLKANANVVNGTVITNTGTFDTVETPLVTSVTTTTVANVILTITKTNNVTGFTNPGKSVAYTVVVTNPSTAAAENVVLTDVLPTGFAFVLGGGTTKSFTLGTIAAGQSLTTTYEVAVTAGVASGIYTNTATAQGSNTNSVSATSVVDVRKPQILGITAAPKISITKTASPKSTTPGSQVVYTVTVVNSGDVDATNVVVTDKLPAGFVVTGTGATTKQWKLGTLAANHQRVLTLNATVGTSVSAGVYQNVATVKADGLEPLNAKKSVTVRVPVVLGLAATGARPLDILWLVSGMLLIASGAFLTFRRLQINGTHS